MRKVLGKGQAAARDLRKVQWEEDTGDGPGRDADSQHVSPGEQRRLRHAGIQQCGLPDLQIDIEGHTYHVYVQKRPGVDDFLKNMSELYEIVIYTASIAKYARPLIERLDPLHYASHHLFRQHCTLMSCGFVKDLNLLGREQPHLIIVDNSPTSYLLQPDNGLPIQTWLGERSDTRLYQLMPILEALSTVDDVRPVIHRVARNYEKNYDQTIARLAAEISQRKARIAKKQVKAKPADLKSVKTNVDLSLLPAHIRISIERRVTIPRRQRDDRVSAAGESGDPAGRRGLSLAGS